MTDKAKKNQESVAEYVNDLFDAFNKLQVLRVDLSYKKEHANGMAVADVRKDLRHLLTNRRCKPSIFKHCVGHVAKLEHTEDKGPHIHAAFIYDGSQIQKDIFYATKICDYWKETITHGKGLAHNCNIRKDQYESCGIGKVCRNDEEKREKLLSNALSYLTKDDQTIDDVRQGRERSFTRGVAPKRKNKKDEA